ncbi:helix-turn-helix domain-containing protein [Sphingobacterium litopenaei]|uniref:Helix-turn-helix transcriptional regulator n=1 Tax=Sphingobacterium litopenaei TaxID=2763500 RepID=A0ABR7YFE9_9SPHI|nr:helix-turn-helix domain-containing protein [Sphingobacterium litopenaei]MBD1430011.1 helix-turn-helix transcriptional regulator [Sphingobacterium litopenaei]
MIIDRKHFNLKNKCVIEKLHIKTPFRYGAVFQNEACFLYIKDGESTLNSPIENLNLNVSESVLLKCGNYFADLMQKSKHKNCEIFVIHLHKDILQELYKDEVPSFIKSNGNNPFVQKIEKQNIIDHFITSLEFYFQNPVLVNDELLKLKIKELLLLLLQTNNADNIISLFSHLFTPRQANFKEIIQAHLFSNITIPELAILSGRSLSTFKRDFESYFNDTPANYLKNQKLLKANELLASTDFSVREICYAVGFSDTSHFTKLFKWRYNSTPSNFRKCQVLK